MNQRPKLFEYFCLYFLVLSISFPIQVFWLYELEWKELSLIPKQISTLNYFLVAGFISHIPLFLKASPHLRWTLPLLALLVIFNNAYVGSIGWDYSKFTTTFSSLAFVLSLTPLALLEPSRRLLKNPHLRWWLRPKRYMVHYPVHISPDLGGAILSFSYDLSESGTYVPLNDHQEKFVNVGDKTTLFFKVSENENIKYEAEIVRVSKQKGLYPNGVGLRFTNLNAQKKKDIKRLIQLSNFGQPQA